MRRPDAAIDITSRFPVDASTPEGLEGRYVRALASACRRVLSNQDAWQAAALAREEVVEQLRHLSDVLASGETEKLQPGERSADRELQRRLLCLLRRDLLEGGSLPDRELLTLVRRVEELTEALGAEGRQELAAMLSGANGRDLVVELAHDLRSPLTSIMFLAETLRKGQSGEINDVQRQQVAIIYSASLNLVSVASDLIDLAREGDFVSDHHEPEPFSLGETFESVRAMVLPMAHEKHLHLQFYHPEREFRMGSGVRLNRVLLNLTTNAIKFTDSGRVEVLAVERGPSRVEFSVRDTGRGMDEATLATLFQPFRRSESETGFHFSGTGLGLSICRRLVELMGGELQVESRPGYGTRFFFELDLPKAPRRDRSGAED